MTMRVNRTITQPLMTGATIVRTTTRGRALACCALLTALLAALTACGQSSTAQGGAFAIGYQQGLGSAPLMIVQQTRCLSGALPHTQVQFKQFNSGSSIRDGMLAHQLQAGGVGLAPFLVGYTSGVDWRIVSAENEMDFRLMANDPKYRSLKDFENTSAKIAVPAPDSIQAIVLRKAAAQQLGNAHALDTNMVAMGHPDALQALLSGQIAGHVASAPFDYTEAAKGAHMVVDSASLFPQPINNTVVAIQKTDLQQRHAEVNALVRCMNQAKTMLRSHPNHAAAILATASGNTQTHASMLADLHHSDLVWPTRTNGISTVGQFMKSLGMIKTVPTAASVVATS